MLGDSRGQGTMSYPEQSQARPATQPAVAVAAWVFHGGDGDEESDSSKA